MSVACDAMHDAPPTPISPNPWNTETVCSATALIGAASLTVALIAMPRSFEYCWYAAASAASPVMLIVTCGGEHVRLALACPWHDTVAPHLRLPPVHVGVETEHEPLHDPLHVAEPGV